MWFVILVEPVAKGVTDDEIREVMKFSKYRTIWAINNVWCSVFVFLLLSIDAEHFELIIILSFLANSIIDVSLCREVYFPNYSKFRCNTNSNEQ